MASTVLVLISVKELQDANLGNLRIIERCSRGHTIFLLKREEGEIIEKKIMHRPPQKVEMVIDSLHVSLLNYQRVIILKEKEAILISPFGLPLYRQTP